jgi:hypothetical protein
MKKDNFGGISLEKKEKSAGNKSDNAKNNIKHLGGKTFVIMLCVLFTTLINHENVSDFFLGKSLTNFYQIANVYSLTDEEIVPFITSGRLEELERLYNLNQGINGIALKQPATNSNSRKSLRILEKVDAGGSFINIAREEDISRQSIVRLVKEREENIYYDKVSNWITNNPNVTTINSGDEKYTQMYYKLVSHAFANHSIFLSKIYIFSFLLSSFGFSILTIKIAIAVIMQVGVKSDGRTKTGYKKNYTHSDASSDAADMTSAVLPIMLFSIKCGYLIHLVYFLGLWYFYDGLFLFLPVFIFPWLIAPLFYPYLIVSTFGAWWEAGGWGL